MNNEEYAEKVAEILTERAKTYEAYIVGNARLVFGEIVFEPGAPFTGLELLPPGQLQYFIDGGHLIRIEENT